MNPMEQFSIEKKNILFFFEKLYIIQIPCTKSDTLFSIKN